MEQIEQYTEYAFNQLSIESLFFILVIGITLCLGIALSALKHARRSHKRIPHAQTKNPPLAEDTSLSGRVAKLEQSVAMLDTQLPRTAIVRYNPFRDSGVGGNQSFTLATLDHQGNGSLITHLFSRDMSRVSAKHIVHWQSDIELSPEEKQVINQLRAQ